MSLANVKKFGDEALNAPTTDKKLKWLAEAIYELAKMVDDLGDEIKKLQKAQG
jgi:hypothetical protein